MWCGPQTVVGAVLAVGVACGGGGTPSTPSSTQPVSIAGHWVGQMSYVSSAGPTMTGTYVMDLTQSGAAVSGTWSNSVDFGEFGVETAGGSISGTTTGSTFTGNGTWSATVATTCTGRFDISGSASGTAMVWTSPGITQATCSRMPTNLRVTVQRQ